jgi:hypothetical protein
VRRAITRGRRTRGGGGARRARPRGSGRDFCGDGGEAQGFAGRGHGEPTAGGHEDGAFGGVRSRRRAVGPPAGNQVAAAITAQRAVRQQAAGFHGELCPLMLFQAQPVAQLEFLGGGVVRRAHVGEQAISQ